MIDEDLDVAWYSIDFYVQYIYIYIHTYMYVFVTMSFSNTTHYDVKD